MGELEEFDRIYSYRLGDNLYLWIGLNFCVDMHGPIKGRKVRFE